MRAQLEKALLRNNSKLYQRTSFLISLAAIISILSISLETVSSLEKYELIFTAIEYVTVTIFCMEYLARTYVKENRFEYVLSFYGLMDLLSFAPSILGLANLTFIKSVRIIRIISFLRASRLIKLGKMNKYSNSNSSKAKEIQLISVRIYLLVLITSAFTFGTLLYTLEGITNPLFKDIPSSVLWVTHVILGGSASIDGLSYGTRFVITGIQFTSLLLFGFLLHVVGRFMEKKLLGSKTIADR